MKIWNRITLSCYEQPGEEKAPWYAYPLGVLAVLAWLGAYVVLGSGGY